MQADFQFRTNQQRRITMSNHQDSRVLGRQGARELTAQEVNNVGGGLPVTTTFCTSIPHRDGDDD